MVEPEPLSHDFPAVRYERYPYSSVVSFDSLSSQVVTEPVTLQPVGNATGDMIAVVPDANGKAARSGWRAIRQEGGRTLVEFRPETGRTHQIRVHAASGLGVAVVGDPVYGRADAGGMLLHAADLTIARGAKEPIVASAPVPERFGAFAA